MRVPLTLIDFLERGALHGDRLAVVDEPGGPASLGELTHSELERRSRGMACELDRMGVGHGARIAIVSPNSARFVIALFGVSAFGRILVPINFRLNSDEVAYIVDHSGAQVLLVDPDLQEPLAGVDAPHKVVLDGSDDAALFAATDAAPAHWEPDEDATASINYTSGTTARPKGVQLTHRTLWLHTASICWHLGVSPRTVYLQGQPLFHCNGWGLPYGLTVMGARQVILRRVDGDEILRRVDEHGVTLTCGAPAVVDAVLRAAEARTTAGPIPGSGRMRIFVGGASPPTSLIQRVTDELGWEFTHGYGLTESSPLLTVNLPPPEDDALPAQDRARRLARQGLPAIGVRVRVDDQGEVLARSNHVLVSYWDDHQATEAAITDGWLHTGDGGVIDQEHYLTVTDRKKDVIITGGESVSSVEVEDCLYSHPDIREVAVIGVPDARWGETVKALVVVREGSELDEAAFIAFTRERIAHFKCPTSVEFREALPRTATGKIQKFRLRAPYWEGHAPAREAGG
jgi:acyl-CoA synthetase (AMP-forming)/AMP-acid ligase II